MQQFIVANHCHPSSYVRHLFSYFSGLLLLARSVCDKLKEKWTIMNFFKTEYLRSRRMYSQRMILMSSRIYFIAVTLAVIVLALFNGMTNITISATIKISSLAQFEQLHAAYPSTLSCPCQSLAVPYSAFVTLTPVYHQVRYMLDLHLVDQNSGANFKTFCKPDLTHCISD